MKKLDKLVLKAFIGPFILTFIVVVFILLLQYMLKYFDDLVGKGLGFEVFAELMSSFSIVMTPNALPLAILLSSLMTFGNLGEHFELTAIKSAGISLLRAMAPIFYFAIVLTLFAFYSNNFIVPKAALNAYSLMYDVRQQKPALNIQEGAFYNGIQGFTIRVNEKSPDGEQLKKLVIYDHTAKKGNIDLIMADSGRMYSFMDNKYLVMELYHGNRFSEAENSDPKNRQRDVKSYVRSSFDQTKMLFSLEDFDLKKTKKELFANNRLMKNIVQLDEDVDSMQFEMDQIQYKVYANVRSYYTHHMKDMIEIPPKYLRVKEILDSIRNANDSIAEVKANLKNDSIYKAKLKDSLVIASPENPNLIGKDKNANFKSKSKSVNSSATTKLKKNSIDKVDNNKVVKKPTKKVDPVKSKRNAEVKRKSIERAKKKRAKKVATKKKTVGKKGKSKKGREPVDFKDAVFMTDSIMALDKNRQKVIAGALTKARQMKNHMVSQERNTENLVLEKRKFQIEKNKKYALALACLSMFLIGAPLGSIIKKGGLGIPVILSVFFFIMFYVINITGEKMAKQGVIEPWMGAWAANFILLPIGLFFLRQARIDARLFEVDFYNVIVANIKRRFGKNTETNTVSVKSIEDLEDLA